MTFKDSENSSDPGAAAYSAARQRAKRLAEETRSATQHARRVLIDAHALIDRTSSTRRLARTLRRKKDL